MKELFEFLNKVKVKKYNDLICSIELQKDILEEISTELGNSIPKLIADKKMDEGKSIFNYIEIINKKIEEINELLNRALEANEEDVEENDESLIKEYEKYRVNENEKHTLYESFKHKRPCAFEIENTRFEANSWKNVLISTCNYLIKKNRAILEDIVTNQKIKGRKRILFSPSKKLMYSPEKLKNINGYVETNLSADRIRNLIKELLKMHKVSIAKYHIYFRVDYSEMNR